MYENHSANNNEDNKNTIFIKVKNTIYNNTPL